MNVRCIYSGRDKSYEWPDERWPHGDLEMQARTAIALWLENDRASSRFLWDGTVHGITEKPGGRISIAVSNDGGMPTFDFIPSNIGGPW